MSKASIQERKEFLKTRVNPILEVLVADLMKDRPSQVVRYMIDWLNDKGEAQEEESQNIKCDNLRPEGVEDSSDEEDDEEGDEVESLPMPALKPNAKQNRISVSAEAYGTFNKKGNYQPRVVPKSDETKQRIAARLGEVFMFSNQDHKEKNIVLDAMEEFKFKSGDSVIKQGEDGDVLYVVDSGNLDCYRKPTKDGEDVYLKTYTPGEAFGELALQYNAPRAATIKAKEDSVLFGLDRDCFNNIVKESSIKKREKYEAFLGRVQLLDSQDSYEKNKICDCLKHELFSGVGMPIIKQGEQGNTFYLLVEGTCSAFIRGEDGKEKQVFEYKPNDYFGELALLRDEPRAATIKTTSATTIVAYIDRLAFKRLLGPLEKILQRNAERYTKYMKDKK